MPPTPTPSVRDDSLPTPAAGRGPLSRRASLRLVAAAACGAVLSGCVVAPVGRPVYRGEPYPGRGDPYPGRGDDGYGYGYGDVVTVAPPAPQIEYVGAPPVVGHIWIGGYWNWVGGRFSWSPGYWSAPRPGYRWSPHAWVPYRGGWRLNHGRWSR